MTVIRLRGTDMASITELYAILGEFRDRRNWARFHTPKNLAISVSIEAAELLELFQWQSDLEIEDAKKTPGFTAAASDEIADVLIYLTLLAGQLGIDPITAALEKLEKNEKRFPAAEPNRQVEGDKQ